MLASKRGWRESPDRLVPVGNLRRRTPLAAALALVLAAALPASASAAERFAAPGGGPAAGCSQADPCDLVTAINGAAGGDSVFVAPGSYGSPSARIATVLSDGGAPLTIRGQTIGANRPVIWLGGSAQLFLTGSGTTVADLHLEHDNGQPLRGGALQGELTVTRVLAHATGSNAAACALANFATVADSVCWASGDGSSGILADQPYGFVLRNVTAVGTRSGIRALSSGEYSYNGIAFNTIASGTTDIELEPLASMALEMSNYDTTAGSVTPPGTQGNQTAPPAFVDPASGDFHPQPSSPTIDAGTDDPQSPVIAGCPPRPLELVDLDGNSRSSGAGTDIGAFESPDQPLAVPGSPLVSTGPANRCGDDTPSPFEDVPIELTGTVNSNGAATTYYFEYGPTTAYGWSTPHGNSGVGTSAQSASAVIAGLTAETIYHYRLTASNRAGTTHGADATFTSHPAAPPTLPEPPAPGGLPTLPDLPEQPGDCAGRPTLAVVPAGFGPVRGTRGRDVVTGSESSDDINGAGGNDLICGRGGGDLLAGSDGSDWLLGGSGRDRLSGGHGGDRLSGGDGPDRLDGRSGVDRLAGHAGRDALNGGRGNDRIAARGGGRDTVNCGPGRDRVAADLGDRLRGCERVRRVGL
jgi:hypothetical protein